MKTSGFFEYSPYPAPPMMPRLNGCFFVTACFSIVLTILRYT